MISESTLKKWRKEALNTNVLQIAHLLSTKQLPQKHLEDNKRILKLTQELMDQHLLKGKKQ